MQHVSRPATVVVKFLTRCLCYHRTARPTTARAYKTSSSSGYNSLISRSVAGHLLQHSSSQSASAPSATIRMPSCRPVSLSPCWTATGQLSHSISSLRSLDVDGQSSAVNRIFSIIEDAARRGENFGVDESPTSRDELSALVSMATTETFLFRDRVLGVIEAVVLVTPCPHARTSHPTLCTIQPFAASSLQQRAGPRFWPEFLRCAKRLAMTSSTESGRYSACVTNVFVSCVDRLLVHRDAGFHVVACVPRAGRLRVVGGRDDDVMDDVSNYVMYSELDCAVSDVQHDSVLKSPLETTLPSQSDDEIVSSICILALPNLPLCHLSFLPAAVPSQSPPVITVRALKLPEVRLFYEATRAAVDAFPGSYGLDEIPDFEFFARHYVHQNYVTVCELEGQGETGETGETVAYMSFCRSSFSRSRRCVINDANLLILPQFRRNNWAPHLLAITALMSRDAGFKGSQGEAAVTNLASVLSMTRNGAVTNGCLPRAIYLEQTGWTDLHMTYTDLTWLPSTSLDHQHLDAKL